MSIVTEVRNSAFRSAVVFCSAYSWLGIGGELGIARIPVDPPDLPKRRDKGIKEPKHGCQMICFLVSSSLEHTQSPTGICMYLVSGLGSGALPFLPM